MRLSPLGVRTIPDVAFDAAPNTGVAVYDSYNNTNGSGPWEQVGGTSLSAPSWAGLIAIANQGRVAAGGTTLTGPTQTLPALYSLPSSDFNDITSGSNGGFSAQPGYDEVTGLGTPKANLLVPALAAYGTTTGTSQLAVTAQPPSSVTAGAPFGLTIAVENANGSLNTSYRGGVTIALLNNPGGSTLGGTLTVTAQNGVATFIGLTLNRTGSGYTIQATAGGSTAVLTNAMRVTPAAASELVVITEPPANVAVNARFGLAVAVEDRFGNIETNTSTSKVTVALAINPVDATLGGTLSVTFKQGIATFSNLSVNKLGRNYAIMVSSPGLSKERTISFNVLTIAAAKQTFVESQPSYVIAARRSLIASRCGPCTFVRDTASFRSRTFPNGISERFSTVCSSNYQYGMKLQNRCRSENPAWFRLRVSWVTWAGGQRNVAFRSAKVLSRSERRQTDPAGVDPSHTELEPPLEPCRKSEPVSIVKRAAELLRVRKVMSAERRRLRRYRAGCGRHPYQPNARARDAGQGRLPMHSRSPRSRVGWVWGQPSESALLF